MLKKTLDRMFSMRPEAWYIFLSSVKLCCLLCLCAFALLKEWNGSMSESYVLYMTAISLIETSQAVLLIGVIGSFCIEAVQS